VRWKMMVEQNGELTDGARTLMKQMERYATGVGCRHRHLSTYFGDIYSAADCGACDVCLGELEEVPEPVPVARKILSCVARVGQRFGVMHVTSVLRGQSVESVLSRGHDRLSTFGLLRNEPLAAVRGYIEQLVGLGLLQVTDDAYPVLSMTAPGVALLKDEAAQPDLTLARQRTAAKGAARSRSRIETESWDHVDRGLFDRLRALRLDLARSRGVPPYVIFHDATLREMARVRPVSMPALLAVRGVGARKAEDLGSVFIDAIRGS
jgi:ATP-dependent DNA helicase RecQ